MTACFSAKDFLEEAKIHLKNGNVQRAIEQLKQVNTQAIKARNLGCNIENEDLKIETLISSTQLLILADLLLESVVNTEEGPVLIPARKMSKTQKENVSRLIENNLGRIIGIIEDTKPGQYFYYLIKIFLMESQTGSLRPPISTFR